MDDQIVFGGRMIPVKLPERTRFVPQGLSTKLPPVENLEAALAMPAPEELAEIVRRNIARARSRPN